MQVAMRDKALDAEGVDVRFGDGLRGLFVEPVDDVRE